MSRMMPRIARSIRLSRPEPGFELSEKQLTILKTTSQVLLALGVVAGTVSLMVLAPNAFQVLDKLPWADRVFGPAKPRRKRIKIEEQKIRKAVYYLKSKGYIKLKPEGDDFLMTVTQKGRRFQKRMKYADLAVDCSGKWDGGWWVVVADIPTSYKARADMFREKLKEMKFYPLQRTVWLFPYDPRVQIDFLSAYWHIDRFVTVMGIREIDPFDERVVKRFFQKNHII